MSISPASSSYMSNEDILAWMETATDSQYDQMRTSMSGANERADAEEDLDKIKAMLVNDSGKDATEVTQLINDTLAKYPDVPDVATVLQPMADKLNTEVDAAKTANANAIATNQAAAAANAAAQTSSHGNAVALQGFVSVPSATVNIDKDDATNWGSQIDNTVSNIGKTDELDMINIQELNSEINQAKQTASALMDSADKSAEATINNIS